MVEDLERLEQRLGYRFKDRELARQALTHRSVSGRNNERLEFLGDAILGFVIAKSLYLRFDQAQEGDLSRLRASLVKGATLAAIGHELGLGNFLRLGSGELKSGGFRRDSILACAVEALIGAIHLDGGQEASDALVLSLFKEKLAHISPETVQKDPKTQLQEYLQSRKMALPEYELKSVEGEPHAQTFFVECRVGEMAMVTGGEGRSRRKAEQQAAEAALKRLQDRPS